MRSRFAILMFSFLLTHALSVGLRAQATGSSSRPDLSGIWDGAGDRTLGGPGTTRGGGLPQSQGGVPAAGFMRGDPPMTASALAVFRENHGDRIPAERGLEAYDPSFYPYCLPRSFPRIYNFDPLIEIVQTARMVYMMFETNNQVRRIYLDGKKHMEGFGPTTLGNSNGRWDGDTLVVETTNIDSLDGRNWLDTYGHPFTDALHVTERMTRPTEDTLQIDFVFDDPGAYTRPWTGRKVLHHRTGAELTDTGICQGPLREEYLRDIRNGTPRGQPW